MCGRDNIHLRYVLLWHVARWKKKDPSADVQVPLGGWRQADAGTEGIFHGREENLEHREVSVYRTHS